MVFIKGNLIVGAEIGLGRVQMKTRGFTRLFESKMDQMQLIKHFVYATHKRKGLS